MGVIVNCWLQMIRRRVMSKGNICIIGLSKQFTDYVGRQLSIRMDMFYANIQEILEFELMNIDEVQEVCGLDYLQREEFSIINRVCSYDNTLVFLEYSRLNDDSILDIVKENCLLIYLSLDEKRFLKEFDKDNLSEGAKKLDIDMMQDRDFLCRRISDITVECEDLKDNDLIDNIIEQILKYYSK